MGWVMHTGLVCGYFFFSSRRRHTRLVSDWSSDVCSSDLDAQLRQRVGADELHGDALPPPPQRIRHLALEALQLLCPRLLADGPQQRRGPGEIGRASCRERGEIWVVGVSLKKKERRDTQRA